MSTLNAAERVAIVAVVGIAVALASAWLFVSLPDTLAELFGVLLVVLTVLAAVRLAGRLTDRVAGDYNVAEVAVEGPIARDRPRRVPSGPTGPTADEVVDQIERADDDGNVDALLVKLNTPGGEIVPSEDIRLAVERFDGPAVGYATDVCASGGYDIASACDELWAREGSLVGSIGVVGSRVNAHELADRLGISYEQFTAGEYKDAGVPLKELEDDERAYLQAIVDDYYDQFVDTVAEGRDLDRETIEETEARVYLGSTAHEHGLVDELGAREDVEDRLEERLDRPVTVRSFEPERRLTERFHVGAQHTAYALGAGIANTVEGDVDGVRFRQ